MSNVTKAMQGGAKLGWDSAPQVVDTNLARAQFLGPLLATWRKVQADRARNLAAPLPGDPAFIGPVLPDADRGEVGESVAAAMEKQRKTRADTADRLARIGGTIGGGPTRERHERAAARQRERQTSLLQTIATNTARRSGLTTFSE